MEPIVDVIIPAYIPSPIYLKLLRRAFQSLEKQTMTDFKTSLVLNGGFCSKEDVLSEIKFYKYLDRLTVHDMGTKASGAAARNYGIQRSTSKYIAQLDVDDAYMPEKLAKQVEHMENNTECSILGTLKADIDKHQNVIHCPTYYHQTHEQIVADIEKFCVLSHGTVMLRADIFKKLNIYYDEIQKPLTVWPMYPNTLMAEDWDLWIRMIKKGAKAYILQEKLYVYTVGTSVER